MPAAEEQFEVINPFGSWHQPLLDKGLLSAEGNWEFSTLDSESGATVKMIVKPEDHTAFTAIVGIDDMMVFYANNNCIRTHLNEEKDGEPVYYRVSKEHSDQIMKATGLDLLASVGVEGFMEVTGMTAPKNGAKGARP